MNRTTHLCLLLAVVAGCDPKSRGNADAPVDGAKVVRAALLDGTSCYAKHPRLCLDDPTFLDAAIASALERRFDGVMPTTRREVQRVTSSARTAYRDSMRSPVGLERVEDRVQAVYDKPTIESEAMPGTVNVDFGALPGELTVSGRVKEIRLRQSPLLDKQYWASGEATARIGTVVEAHPEAQLVRAELRIPRGTGRNMIYRYFPKRRQLVFNERGDRTLRVCEPLADGASLSTSGLDMSDCKTCARAASDASSRWCPIDDPYLKMQRKAEHEARKAGRR